MDYGFIVQQWTSLLLQYYTVSQADILTYKTIKLLFKFYSSALLWSSFIHAYSTLKIQLKQILHRNSLVVTLFVSVLESAFSEMQEKDNSLYLRKFKIYISIDLAKSSVLDLYISVWILTF